MVRYGYSLHAKLHLLLLDHEVNDGAHIEGLEESDVLTPDSVKQLPISLCLWCCSTQNFILILSKVFIHRKKIVQSRTTVNLWSPWQCWGSVKTNYSYRIQCNAFTKQYLPANVLPRNSITARGTVLSNDQTCIYQTILTCICACPGTVSLAGGLCSAMTKLAFSKQY